MKSLEAYRQERLQYLSQSRTGLIVTLSAFIAFLPSGLVGFSSGMAVLPFIVMAVFMFGGFTMAKSAQKLKTLSNEFKTSYIPNAIQSLLPGSDFNIHGGFDEMEVYNSKILNRADRYYSEDLFQGVWEGVGFKTADVVLKDVDRDGEKTTVRTVFMGRVFRLDFQSRFPTDLLLFQQAFVPGWGLGDYHRIRTESIDFNRSFNVYGKDELLSFVLLKPDFIERLMELDQSIHDQITISFQSNRLYMAIRTNRDTFDLNFKDEVPDHPTAEIEQSLKLIKELIRIFEARND